MDREQFEAEFGAFPATPEQRKAGMARFRKQMLAAHERVIAEGRGDEFNARSVDHIKAQQRKFGERA
jgi:hypothetical protein